MSPQRGENLFILKSLRTAEIFPEIEIAHALRSQLSWTQLRFNIPIEDKLKREFYIEMSRLEKWSSKQL